MSTPKYPKEIVLIRHAEMFGNVMDSDDAANHEISNHNFGLTEVGVKQIKHTQSWLVKNYPDGFDAAFVSTFTRTKLTYEALRTGFSQFPNAIQDSRLDEKHDGIIHSLTRQERMESFPWLEKVRKKEGWYHFRAPGGRNGPDVELSIYSFLQYLREFYSGKTCLVICHGNWLLLLMRILNNLSASQINEKKRIVKIPNCCVTTYQATRYGLVLTNTGLVPWKGKISVGETHLG